MKKFFALILMLVLVLSLSACGRMTDTPSVSAEEALETALKEAGVKKEEISNVSTELETDDGRLVYDVDFNVGAAEYSYDISAENGEIISRGD